jgi:hypothetical protein
LRYFWDRAAEGCKGEFAMRRLGLTAAAAMAMSGLAVAAEGMWLPSQAPEIAAAMKAEGLTLDPSALSDLQAAPMNAIVSLGGCSAAFVSPQGLVATNHHCVYGSIQYNSKPDRDLLANGFLAKTFKDEVPAAPGTRVFVIEELRDVTAQMNEGIGPTVLGRARNDRLTRNEKALVAACEQQPNRRCAVRAYFGGSAYYLQQQLEIKDVRLAYAPAGAIGNYGGEVDNWQWPRHTGDFGFYRAYVAPDGSSAPFAPDNVPFKPKSWLKIAAKGVEDGDFVMLAGFPGVTERFRTAAETRAFYEAFYPRQQKLLADYSALIEAAVKGDEDARIKYANAVRGADNFKKKLLGQMDGARAIGLVAKKDAQEQAFRRWALADGRAAALAPVIASLDAVAAEAQAERMRAQTYGLLGRAQLLTAARTLYRWSKEREKPDADREPGFQERDRRFVLERLTQIDRRFVARVDRVIFEAAIREYETLAPADRNPGFDAYVKATGLDRLYAETKLGDAQTRLTWMDKPAADFAASADPMIALAVAMFAADMEREGRDKDRDGRMQAARSAYVAAYRDYAKSQGRALYPDANGSLRLTYGRVRGRAGTGAAAAPFTRAPEIAAKHTGKEPFNAPARQLELIAKSDWGAYASPVQGVLPVNFLSTVDITNGNSGSATLNARGEFVGLAFDGTIEGVIGDWWFDETINRTIHVDSRYMLWVMDKVDGADALLREMGAKP